MPLPAQIFLNKQNWQAAGEGIFHAIFTSKNRTTYKTFTLQNTMFFYFLIFFVNENLKKYFVRAKSALNFY
jgi:hypothetical protein